MFCSKSCAELYLFNILLPMESIHIYIEMLVKWNFGKTKAME